MSAAFRLIFVSFFAGPWISRARTLTYKFQQSNGRLFFRHLTRRRLREEFHVVEKVDGAQAPHHSGIALRFHRGRPSTPVGAADGLKLLGKRGPGSESSSAFVPRTTMSHPSDRARCGGDRNASVEFDRITSSHVSELRNDRPRRGKECAPLHAQVWRGPEHTLTASSWLWQARRRGVSAVDWPMVVANCT